MSDAQYKEHRKKLNDQQKVSRKKRLARMTPEELADYKAKVNQGNQERRDEVRRKVYGHYGDACACCGETEPMFLSLDHTNNDGAEHRRELGYDGNGKGASSATLSWLKRNNYPEGFQVLCMNCNHGKARNGGVCPHNVLHKKTA